MLKASRELAFAVGAAGANLASKFESEAAMLKASRELAFAVGAAGANLASKFESEAAMLAEHAAQTRVFFVFL